MRLWKAWIVARKDFSIFRKNRFILYSLVVLPLVLTLFLPILIFYSPIGNLPVNLIVSGINGLLTFFILIPAILPSVIASYSIVGEKVEKSLEPLLATPTTDGEILFGKILASFIPTILATYLGSVGFTLFVDIEAYNKFGEILLPTWEFAIVMAFAAPLACILSVEINIIISSRVNDIRAAQQLGALPVLPLILIAALAEVSIIVIDVPTLLIISGIFALIDISLYFASRVIFRREEILTKWK
jgi:ABC-type Na+ efflux pump permease subunit